MKQHPKRWREFVFCAVVLWVLTASAQEQAPPKIDHILLEVADLQKSIAFYHDLLGLEIKSQSKDFAMLQSGNVGVFLSSNHWDWDEKRSMNVRPGWGMYPHFAVIDVAATVERARKAGRLRLGANQCTEIK
jgi:catechol 2,3-dioxygenase-like lactoylglutathione lyase family enzyme